MSKPAQKCKKQCYFKQNFTLLLFITFKMAYSCWVSFWENLENPDVLQKKSFITSLTG